MKNKSTKYCHQRMRRYPTWWMNGVPANMLMVEEVNWLFFCKAKKKKKIKLSQKIYGNVYLYKHLALVQDFWQYFLSIDSLEEKLTRSKPYRWGKGKANSAHRQKYIVLIINSWKHNGDELLVTLMIGTEGILNSGTLTVKTIAVPKNKMAISLVNISTAKSSYVATIRKFL